MKLTREQVEEIKKQFAKVLGSADSDRPIGDSMPKDLIYNGKRVLDCVLESFIEPEYKCPCCGNPLHNMQCIQLPCRFGIADIERMACYKDDWNGGKV